MEVRSQSPKPEQGRVGPPNPMFYRFTDCGGVRRSSVEGWTFQVPSPLVVLFHFLTPRSHLPPTPSLFPISNRSRPLSHLRRSVSLPALILRQINASLSSRRFTNQSGASVQNDRSRAEARTIRNSNENSPLYLPPNLRPRLPVRRLR